MATQGEIHPATRLGPVHLTVASLERQLAFYQQAVGFTLHWREEGRAGLGAGREDLLVLTELVGARRSRGTTGMYHFAILVPNRRELARCIARLIQLRVPQAPTDHTMTETTYLDDPEGNNIEIYADTPEDGTWGMENGEFVARDKNGVLRSGRDPLDLDELMENLLPGDRLDAPLPSETKIGHIHLFVSDVDKAMHFYRDVLTFGEQFHTPQIGFVSAGGYHHHIGVNSWIGRGAPSAPPGSTGMRYYTVVLPDRAELERLATRLTAAGIPIERTSEGVMVADPSQNRLLLTVEA